MTEVPKEVVGLFDYTSWIWKYTHSERYQEMKGMVEVVNEKDITLSHVILINFLYELESWCTSIIAQQANGTIIHSRNLDFDFADEMRKITFNARFIKDGKYKFDAVMFAGTIGLYTGFKEGAYSISEN